MKMFQLSKINKTETTVSSAEDRLPSSKQSAIIDLETMYIDSKQFHKLIN